jgi:glutamine amidotransferase
MSCGPRRLSAEFWLLDAADSLRSQSHRDPDGTGLGTFDPNGTPIVEKAPISAFSDSAFAQQAHRARSRTFVAHVRFASTGTRSLVNTHPFELDQRLFAHNGVVSGLDLLDAQLGEERALVQGETDSERVFALITREIRRSEGNVRAGLDAALQWIVENLPLYALNFILTSERDVWALRYPSTHGLYVLERAAGGHHGGRTLHHRSSLGTRIDSAEAAVHPVTVFASEPMDDEPGWRELESGELVHVDDTLRLSSTILLPRPPARLLTAAELDEHTRASQLPAPDPRA